ncbi:MAG: right-handed parallel beta-helix repeat-containing protein [Planctomycetes bacterium]|nr:right-handed parallel beta-helix repeat-containing protein [Planctomycetota bacterium]
MKRSKCVLFALLAGMVLCAGARPVCAETTWYVDDDAPADFATIQAAINASADGDTIIVRDGTYTGDGNRDIDFGGRAIHLRSENGPEACVIDCQGTEIEPHRGFHFHSGEDEDSVVDGFTITGGFVHGIVLQGSGGGIYIRYSSPTIVNSIIVGNISSAPAGSFADGGGIYCRSASPLIVNTLVSGNSAKRGTGGGVFVTLSASQPVIANSVISANTTPNSGGGLCFYSSSSPVISCSTITANSAGAGGGIFCRYGALPTVTTKCITCTTGFQAPHTQT